MTGQKENESEDQGYSSLEILKKRTQRIFQRQSRLSFRF
jgi:hypothetical protein